MTTVVPTEPSSMRVAPRGNPQSLRVAAVLLFVGEIVYAVVTPLLHPGGGPDAIAEFAMYADSRSWLVVHSLQFASAIAIAFGLLALVHGLDVRSGIRGLTNRCAAASATAGLGLSGVLYAVDGVALKEAVDTWIGKPPASQPAYLAVVEGVRGIEWGLRSYVAYTFGLTLVLLAIVIVATARVPRPVGYLMALTGLIYIAVGVGYGSSVTALDDHSLVGNVNYYLVALIVLWSIWLFASAARMGEPDLPADERRT